MREAIMKLKYKSKLMKDGAIELMNANIFPDEEGFIYYNELLFYLYKHYMKTSIEEQESNDQIGLDEKALEIIEDEQKIIKMNLNIIKK